jgi:hypothetical protein
VSEEAEKEEADDEAAAGDEGAQTISDFLARFGGDDVQFMIGRVEPKTAMIGGKLRKVAGHLETTRVEPTHEYIKENWGGGYFDVRAQRLVRGKRPRYLGAARVEIAGDPRMRENDLTPSDTPTQPPESPEILARVLDQAYDDKIRHEERLEAERRRLTEERERVRREGQDPAAWEAALETVRATSAAQVSGLQREIERRDRDLSDLRRQMEAAREAKTPFTDPEFYKVIFGRNNEDSAHLRELHRAEQQAERDRATREMQAERERALRELDGERREHTHAVEMMERMHRSEVENLKLVHGQAAAAKDETIRRLSEELRTARASFKPTDTLSEIERMGQVFQAVKTMQGEPQGPPPTGLLERIVDRLGPAMGNLLENATRQSAVPMVVGPGGMLVPLHPQLAQGAFHAPTQPPVPQPGGMPVAEAATDAPAPPPAGSEAAQPAAPAAGSVQAELLQGLEFVETAIRGGKDPADVARSARGLFPRALLTGFVEAGPDLVHAQAEQLSPNSALASPGGKRYLRDLTEALRVELARSG